MLTDDDLDILQVCGSSPFSDVEISDRVSIPQKEVAEKIQNLVSNGFIERIPDPAKYVKWVFILTNKGWEIVNQIWEN
jgi:DNA-binding MarR family transcriptional regulator